PGGPAPPRRAGLGLPFPATVDRARRARPGRPLRSLDRPPAVLAEAPPSHPDRDRLGDRRAAAAAALRRGGGHPGEADCGVGAGPPGTTGEGEAGFQTRGGEATTPRPTAGDA